MKHPFNYLGLLALPALAALLYFPSGNTDFIGFLGFAYFIRYFWVNPDELFLLTLRRAATGAFILDVALFPLLMLVRYLTAPAANPIPFALGLSFAVSIIVFCLYHTWLEWREMRGLE